MNDNLDKFINQLLDFVEDEGNKGKVAHFKSLKYDPRLGAAGFQKEDEGSSITYQNALDFLANVE